MKKFIALIALCVTCGTAVAGNPTYLDCSFSENRLFKVTLNEDAGTATIDYGTGKVSTYQAKFGANEVRFDDDNSIFTVDRTTLKMTREIPAISSTDDGQCEIVKAPPARKF